MPILDVAYVHKAVVRRPRYRKAEEAWYRDVMPVAIATVSSNEAPVALRIPDADLILSDPEPTLDVRLHDGRLWKPLRAGRDDRDDFRHRDERWLTNVVQDPDGHDNPLAFNPDYQHRKVKLSLRGDPKVAEILSGTEDDVRKSITKAAGDIVSLDGMLWKACPEPVLVVAHHRNAGPRDAKAEVRWFGRGLDIDRVYRLDQADLAAERFAMGPGRRAAFAIPDVEILLPEALTLPITEAALVDAARKMVAHMHGATLEGGIDYLAAFAALRDALPEPVDGERDAEYLTRIPAVRDLVELLAEARAAETALVGHETLDFERWLGRRIDDVTRRVERLAPDLDSVALLSP